MSDQLDLRLTGDVTRLPRTLRPMLPKPAEAPFDSEEHVFEPSWGGRRVIAFIEHERGSRDHGDRDLGGRWSGHGGPDFGGPAGEESEGPAHLRLVDETGRDLAPHLPELAVIPGLVKELPVILDGELIVPDLTGRMDEPALAGRLADGQTTGLAPVLLVFDLLWVAGHPILALPLLRRRERLARVVAPGPELVIVPGVVRDGRDLHAAVAQQGLPGVMARHIRSPYLPGRRSELWRWIAAEPGHAGPRPLPDPLPAAQRPVLALIQRLPLED